MTHEAPPQLTPARRLALVRTNPAFMAYCSLVGRMVGADESGRAYRALVEMGAPDHLAFEIVDGWPTREEHRRMADQGVSMQEEAACRFSCYVTTFEQVDWAEKLRDLAAPEVPPAGLWKGAGDGAAYPERDDRPPLGSPRDPAGPLPPS